jgi:Malic enzyme, NAD binding domain/Cysteine-rich domain
MGGSASVFVIVILVIPHEECLLVLDEYGMTRESASAIDESIASLGEDIALSRARAKILWWHDNHAGAVGILRDECCGFGGTFSVFDEVVCTKMGYDKVGDHAQAGAEHIVSADSSCRNPTDKAECSAEQAYTWSKGRALYAAGVQFPDVTVNGRTFHPGQANNFYIFPAIGLASPGRGGSQTPASLPLRSLVLIRRVRACAREACCFRAKPTRVAEFMFDEGLAQVERPRDICAWIENQRYRPRY